MSAKRVLGRPVPRIEDRPLVTGRGRYVADIDFPGQLHLRIVRSPYAHGRIRSIDTATARALPGVVAVWTHADVADLPPIPLREGPNPVLAPYLQYVLVPKIARYVGDPVAAVFAEDPWVAEDAAEQVEIDMEELPPVLDASLPPAEFSPDHNTEPIVVHKGYGDLEAAFRAAHMVVELDVKVGRHSGVPLETRGIIARLDTARDVLELHGAAKVPHRNRESLARMLGRSLASVHLYESHVGGSFGVRGELYPEDVLASVGAIRFGRPVKWIEDRYENLIATNHSRDQRHMLRAAIAADGEVLGLEDIFFHDQGAYARTHGYRVVDLTASMVPGPYRIRAFRIAGHFRLTNKTPAATMRAPGRFEGTFARERLMDLIAAKLGMDPLAVRRRNLIGPHEMPFERNMTALGDRISYDSGDYPALLERALTRLDWDRLQADLARRRATGEAVGAGIAIIVEKSGLGPTDGARVSVDTTGAIEVVTGGASVGQGFETAMAQICAEQLGVDYSAIRVVHGRTDRIEHGVGAHAARATVLTGSAVHVAAGKVRQKALNMASELLDVSPEQLDLVDGAVVRRDSADRIAVSLAEIAQALSPLSRRRGEREPGLAADGWFSTDHMAYPYGVHGAVVRVDRDTGGVQIERYLVAYDVGRAVNPLLIEGQLVGGVIQGIGGALYEEFTYDTRGEPLSVTFADYLIPTAHEAPRIEVLLTEDHPSPRNPLGLKGAGEGGINGPAAALAQAIDQALGLTVGVRQTPITPQRIRALLDSA